VTLDALEALDDAPARDALLLPIDAPLAGMPRVDVDADGALTLIQGRTVGGSALLPGRYRCYAESRFLGIVDVAGSVLRPLRMTRSD
jgi:hypothetical protein